MRGIIVVVTCYARRKIRRIGTMENFIRDRKDFESGWRILVRSQRRSRSVGAGRVNWPQRFRRQTA